MVLLALAAPGLGPLAFVAIAVGLFVAEAVTEMTRAPAPAGGA